MIITIDTANDTVSVEDVRDGEMLDASVQGVGRKLMSLGQRILDNVEYGEATLKYAEGET